MQPAGRCGDFEASYLKLSKSKRRKLRRQLLERKYRQLRFVDKRIAALLSAVATGVEINLDKPSSCSGGSKQFTMRVDDVDDAAGMIMQTAFLPWSLHCDRLLHSKSVSAHPCHQANFDELNLYIFKGVMQVTVKYGKLTLNFEGISRATKTQNLLSLLEMRLGAKIPGNAQLVYNGRFLKMNDTMEEVRAASS